MDGALKYEQGLNIRTQTDLTPNNYKDDSLYLKMIIVGCSKKFKEGLFLLLLNKLFVG